MRFLSFLLILTIFSFTSRASELAEGECTPYSELGMEKFIEEKREPWYDPAIDKICKIKGKECLSRLGHIPEMNVCTRDLLKVIHKIKKLIARDDAKALAKLLTYPTTYITIDRRKIYINSEKEFVEKYYKEIFDEDAKKIFAKININIISAFWPRYDKAYISLLFLCLSPEDLKIEYIILNMPCFYEQKLLEASENRIRRTRCEKNEENSLVWKK